MLTPNLTFMSNGLYRTHLVFIHLGESVWYLVLFNWSIGRCDKV